MSEAAEIAKDIVENIHDEFWKKHDPDDEVDSQLVLAEQFGADEVQQDLSDGFVSVFMQRIGAYGQEGAYGAILVDGIMIGRELERRGIGC